MKKIILTIAFIASGMVASAQVGIGNEDPKVSLQVDRSTDNAQADGILVPRTTVAQLNDKAAAYAEAQNGTLVFITEIAGVANQTSNIAATGFHYFDSASNKWVALRVLSDVAVNSVFSASITGDVDYSQNNASVFRIASNAGPGNYNITLPNPASNVGRIIVIANVGPKGLTVTNAFDTATPTISTRSTGYISDGTNWVSLAN